MGAVDLSKKPGEINEAVEAQLKFSVVIPCRNEGPASGGKLQGLLELLAQEKGLDDVIVIDNNSNVGDDTVFFVKLFQRENPQIRIRLITDKNEQHAKKIAGVSEARNIGVSEAEHEIVIMLDADTRYEPGTLQKAALEFKRKELDAAKFYFDPDVKTVLNSTAAKVFNLLQKLVDTFSPLTCVGAALMVDKSFHQVIGGFDITLRACEDAAWAQNVAKSGGKMETLKDVRAIFNTARFYKPDGSINWNTVRTYFGNAVHITMTGGPSPAMLNLYGHDRQLRSYE